MLRGRKVTEMDTPKTPDSFPGDFFSQVEEAREAVKLFIDRKLNYLQNQMPAGYNIELQVKISTDPERKDDNATYMRIGMPRFTYSGIKLAPPTDWRSEEGEEIGKFTAPAIFKKVIGFCRGGVARG